MSKILIKEGLDLPLDSFSDFQKKGEIVGTFEALNLKKFSYLRLHPIKKEGEKVSIGEPLVYDKEGMGACFLSPVAGKVHAIKRGLKRAIDYVVIERGKDEFYHHKPIDPSSSKEELMKALSERGLLPHVTLRPFGVLPRLNLMPLNIFVKAIESAPFEVPVDYQLEGHEKDFQNGLNVLSYICPNVHLIHGQDVKCKAVLHAQNVKLYQARGPHPIANPSVHIQRIAPIKSVKDVAWTLNVYDVITLGKLAFEGVYHHTKSIHLAGPAIEQEKRGIYQVSRGVSICDIEKPLEPSVRLISGNPLTGTTVSEEDFLGFDDFVISAFFEEQTREFLHFFRSRRKKFSATSAYLSSKLPNFTTSQNGEHRAFIDGSLYDRMTPLKIPVMPLVKAAIADDYEAMERLGILEVLPEDFALPAFICPSKIEMVKIIQEALLKHFSDQLV